MKRTLGKYILHRLHLSQTQAGWCDVAKPLLHRCIPPAGKLRGWLRRRVMVAGKNGTLACHLSPPLQGWVNTIKWTLFTLAIFFFAMWLWEKLWVCTWVSSYQGPVVLCNHCEQCPGTNCHHSENQMEVHGWRERRRLHAHLNLRLLVMSHSERKQRRHAFSAFGKKN